MAWANPTCKNACAAELLATGPVYEHLVDSMNNVYTQLSYHPEYLKEFLNSESCFMDISGPLREDYRHFIAMMAAARHQCTPLINYHKQKFLKCGGDRTWLMGLDRIPKRFRNLMELNKILAHNPWVLRRSHVQIAIRSPGNNWTVGELYHIIIIMCHNHCFSSFVYASEVLRLIEEENTKERTAKVSEDASVEKKDKEKKEKEHEKGKEMKTHEEPKNVFKKFEVLRAESDAYLFLEDPPVSMDCEAAKDIYPPPLQDWCWEAQGFSLLDNFYSNLSEALDQKFKIAYDLTYYTMGHKKNVDTTIFRRAVWNFIHRIYGLVHDDYNYDEMEELLDPGFKTYIKAVCLYPEKISQNAQDEIMRAFRHSEKVHVNIMLFEARLQAELLYGLSGIMNFMK